MTVDGLGDLCDEYLDAVLVALGTTDDGAPDTAYVSPASPPLDCCPMVAVWASGPEVASTSPLSPALAPGGRSSRYGSVFLVTVTATFVRCVPTPQSFPPTDAELAAVELAAKQIQQDVWAVWNYLHAQRAAGVLWAGLCREAFFEAAVPIAASGGCAGWNVTARVQLDGYSPAT